MFELCKSCKYRFGYIGMPSKCSTCDRYSNYEADSFPIFPETIDRGKAFPERDGEDPKSCE